MRNFLVSFLLLVVPIASPSPARGFSLERVYGSWRVVHVICTECAGPVKLLKDEVITIDRKNVRNPVADDCPTVPGMEFVKERSVAEVLAGPGVGWPKQIRDTVALRSKLLFGFITCAGINYMQVAFVSPDAGFYFLEGDTALALKRVR